MQSGASGASDEESTLEFWSIESNEHGVDSNSFPADAINGIYCSCH